MNFEMKRAPLVLVLTLIVSSPANARADGVLPDSLREAVAAIPQERRVSPSPGRVELAYHGLHPNDPVRFIPPYLTAEAQVGGIGIEWDSAETHPPSAITASDGSE